MKDKKIFITSSSNPQLCIDVNEGSKKDSANLILFEYKGSPNQIWIRQGSCLVSQNSGKAIDISGGEQEGNKIIQYSKHGKQNQQWQIFPTQSPGLVYIASPSGLALTVKGNNIRSKADIVASRYNGSPNQHWIINYC